MDDAEHGVRCDAWQAASVHVSVCGTPQVRGAQTGDVPPNRQLLHGKLHHMRDPRSDR